MSEEGHGPQRARLAVDGLLRPPGVAPYLRGKEPDDEGEEQSHGRQHPGRERLERLSALSDGQDHHDDVDRRRGKEGRCKYGEDQARER